MDRRRVAAIGCGLAGTGLGVLGFLHGALGVPSLQRAVERGLVAPGVAGPQMVNWIFSGGAMCLCGALLALWMPDLLRGRRSAWRSALVVGIFYVLVGLGAYLWVPHASVLVFSVVGASVVGPLLYAERQFREP
jgi:hypothetical protein